MLIVFWGALGVLQAGGGNLSLLLSTSKAVPDLDHQYKRDMNLHDRDQ